MLAKGTKSVNGKCVLGLHKRGRGWELNCTFDLRHVGQLDFNTR